MQRLDGQALLKRLPAVKGRLEPDAELAPLTWFRAGGKAELLFAPADEADLAQFLAAAPADIPVTVIGVGSNLLVRDGGVPGVVIRLGKGFSQVEGAGHHRIRAGAAALDVRVARVALDLGITGLTFLRGIPGTIGGALRMNGGAYGGETKDILVEARAVDRSG
ncbi:MAG: FAD-binding protein, partial [Rhizobiales bacterium]|nr:FAD-binding protein [Hyphomicrobiales bacterium]